MILVKPSHEIITKINGDDLLKRIESAGRTCYKSESKITASSAEKFVAQIIKSGHHSVIEHENISVRFICDRGVTHEIVRHRLAAYSQESTRYCDYGGKYVCPNVMFIIPPWISVIPGEYHSIEEITNFPDSYYWTKSMLDAERMYATLRQHDWTPQQARSVLPNSLKTEIVMTANLREWRHVLKLRTSKAAHPQMRELMVPLLMDLQETVPVIFDDIKEDWYDTKLWRASMTFFQQMVEKLIHQNNTHGFSGWDKPDEVTDGTIRRKLMENIEKEDWVDVANLAMMLDYRRGT